MLVEQEAPFRYANYQFYHRADYKDPTPIQDGAVLRAEHAYELEVWISATPAGMPIGDQEGKRRPIREPDSDQDVTIYVLF
jgi:hypothetical protein